MNKYVVLQETLNKMHCHADKYPLVHDIPTPFSIVEEMIEATTINSSDTIIVFNLEFAIALVHKYNIEPKRITIFADFCPTTETWAARLGINYIDAWNYNMVFDVVLGNPPYDGGSTRNVKLWAKFSRMAVDLKPSTIAFVTPNNVVSDKGVNGAEVRKYLADNDYGFLSVRNHDENPFKGVGVSTCHWIVAKGIEDIVDPIVLKEAIVVNDIAQAIVDKVTSYPTKLPLVMENGPIAKSDLVESGEEICFSGPKVRYATAVEGKGLLKVVFPFSVSYHKAFITDKACGMLNLVHYAQSQEEAEFVLAYSQTKLFKLAAKIYRKTSGFTPFVKNCMIPDLRGIDISDIYSTFNLTQEEIDYVEANV